jgi:putative ABC transport system permease protein
MLATYNVSLDPATIGLFFAAAVGTVVIATIIPMLYIVRLNPKKILM